MGDPTLQQIQRRYEQRGNFFRALLTQLCEQCLAILATTTPGTTLPTEWTFSVQAASDGATAKLWSTRLDRDPEFETIMVYLNFGTKPHWIAPVNKLALSWVGADGLRHFSQGHEVAGIAPSLFVQKTDRFIQQFEQTIGQKWAAYMSRGTLPA